MRDSGVLRHRSGVCSQCQPRFNPCEGFGGFATPIQGSAAFEVVVSIPVRDSGVLRPAPLPRPITRRSCFNPCEGFGGFATIAATGAYGISTRFNPCEGFGGFATLYIKGFSPYFLSFNPCEGFGGFATRLEATPKPVLAVFQSL